MSFVLQGHHLEAGAHVCGDSFGDNDFRMYSHLKLQASWLFAGGNWADHDAPGNWGSPWATYNVGSTTMRETTIASPYIEFQVEGNEYDSSGPNDCVQSAS